MSRGEVIKASIDASIENADPDWKIWYYALAKVLLLKQRYVSGDDFSCFMRDRGLWEPHNHNCWVGMPEDLRRKGWIEPVYRVRPWRDTNHMNDVVFWRSTIFDETTLHTGVSREGV